MVHRQLLTAFALLFASATAAPPKNVTSTPNEVDVVGTPKDYLRVGSAPYRRLASVNSSALVSFATGVVPLMSSRAKSRLEQLARYLNSKPECKKMCSAMRKHAGQGVSIENCWSEMCGAMVEGCAKDGRCQRVHVVQAYQRE